MSDLVVQPNFVGKVFGKSPFILSHDKLVFMHGSGKDTALSLASVRTLFQVKKRFLGYELRLEGARKSTRLRFLKADNVTQLQTAANKIIRRHIKAYLQAVFTAFNQHVKLEYPRDSRADELRTLIEELHQHYRNHKAEWQTMLSSEALAAVEEILTLYPFNMASLRAYHERLQLSARGAFFDTVESNALTPEQRLAVLRSDDRNMVLAAAGTGKTSVMVAKALDLIDRNLARPSEILILAYNRTAALELKARLIGKAENANISLPDEPQICTFHALGKTLLQQAGTPVNISVFAENSSALKQWVFQWIQEYVSDDNDRVQVLAKLVATQEQEAVSASLDEATLSSATEILTKALQALRMENLNKAGISTRLKAAGIPQAAKSATLLQALHNAYESELKRQDCLDFDDLINNAAQIIQRGKIAPVWKYVLVDEFQDISASRMALVEKILEKGPSPSLTVVGDDWQSIYRFSGGKLELTTRFGELVGSYTETKLQKTFRYNNSIADTAGQFIMANPEQHRKYIDTHHKVDTPQIFLLDNKPGSETGIYERITEVVAKIRSNETDSSIAVIARYNRMLDEAKDTLTRQSLCDDVRFWSFHKSKGLEADHCILIGFSSGRNGFPAQGREHPLIEALLPGLDAYPHSEERRLMYVGLTRARHKCYIIADPLAPSVFVTELLSPQYAINVASAAFQAQ